MTSRITPTVPRRRDRESTARSPRLHSFRPDRRPSRRRAPKLRRAIRGERQSPTLREGSCKALNPAVPDSPNPIAERVRTASPPRETGATFRPARPTGSESRRAEKQDLARSGATSPTEPREALGVLRLYAHEVGGGPPARTSAPSVRGRPVRPVLAGRETRRFTLAPRRPRVVEHLASPRPRPLMGHVIVTGPWRLAGASIRTLEHSRGAHRRPHVGCPAGPSK